MFRRSQEVAAEVLNLARRPLYEKSDRDAPVGQRVLFYAISPRGETASSERPIAALGLQTGGAHKKEDNPVRKRMYRTTQRRPLRNWLKRMPPAAKGLRPLETLH